MENIESTNESTFRISIKRFQLIKTFMQPQIYVSTPMYSEREQTRESNKHNNVRSS